MADLISQKTLFSIDPTEGFVQYTQAVKPYHTKILDVLVEYVYQENISVTLKENWDWTIGLVRPTSDVLPSCGFGVVWDSTPFVVNDFPTAIIKQAVGDTPIELTFLSDLVHPEYVLISYNPDEYLVNINDPITFQTTGTLPTTTIGGISPGLVYYVTSVSGNILTIARTIMGPSLIFTDTGSGHIYIHQENIKYNSFLVVPSVATQYQCIATNLKANQFTFINAYTIVAIDASLKKITVSGDITSVALADVLLYIHDNSGNSTNSRYMIVSSSLVSGNTDIIVSEPISLLAQNDGTVNIQDDIATVPNWMIGLKVKVTSSNTLPTPLLSTDSYYFVPTSELGVFNLSTKSLPTSIADIVDITGFGTGTINIQRDELFYPGAVVNVQSTYLSRNNGTFFIKDTVVEGSYIRVNTLQKVNRTTPSFQSMDGAMFVQSYAGYDLPNYCINLATPDLYTSAFIDERITFEFIIDFNEEIRSQFSEDDQGIHDTPEFAPYTSITQIGQVLLPMGLDTQYFDLGVLDEDQHYDNHNLGNTL